jgi:hypothetical protein
MVFVLRSTAVVAETPPTVEAQGTDAVPTEAGDASTAVVEDRFVVTV